MKSLPSALHAHLGYWLRLVSNDVSRRFARQVEQAGVTVAEWVVLRALFDHNALQPSALAGTLGLTRGAVSKLADRLEKKSLLERHADESDGRVQTLRLTPAARELVPHLANLADENDATFFDPLPAADRATLTAILHRLARHHDLKQSPTD